MAQLTFPVLGVLDNTPDSAQKDFKFQVARNNGRGRIELKTSKDRGVTYKVLVPEIISSTTAGSILTVQDDGSAEWSRPKSNLVTVNGATLTVNRTMNLTGTSGTTYNLDDISINPGEVTLAMMANIDASAGVKVVGRSTASSGAPQVLSASGTGNVAMTVSPTFTGTLAAAAVTAAAVTATSINGITITAGTGTITLNNRTLALNGNITTSSAGYISTGGGSVTGGYIDTVSGGSIDTGSGGYIYTRDGGGNIDTTGNGSIGLGIAANRITLQGTAGSNGKFATLPNLTGTVVVTANVGVTATHALFANTTGFPAYRAIATGDLPSIASGLTGILPGANGGTGVANTSKTITLGASLTTTGAGAATFALGASTQTYTFPTATATLASLTGTETLTNKTLTAPVLGAATATSINGITITAAGSGTLTMAGSINTGVGGGSINTSNGGGNINTSGSGVYFGGYINTSGGATGGGGSINTNNGGGGIYTDGGGGSITTYGTGTIELGTTGTRTTFTGSASGGNKSIALPNLSGTVALTTDTAIPLVASFF